MTADSSYHGPCFISHRFQLYLNRTTIMINNDFIVKFDTVCLLGHSEAWRESQPITDDHHTGAQSQNTKNFNTFSVNTLLVLFNWCSANFEMILSNFFLPLKDKFFLPCSASEIKCLKKKMKFGGHYSKIILSENKRDRRLSAARSAET